MVSNILVIDDDPAVRGAFRLILEDDGFSVREAEDGLKGIEMVIAERPDLIFLDLRMPGIDGEGPPFGHSIQRQHTCLFASVRARPHR